jgi:hypothetical protein
MTKRYRIALGPLAELSVDEVRAWREAHGRSAELVTRELAKA